MPLIEALPSSVQIKRPLGEGDIIIEYKENDPSAREAAEEFARKLRGPAVTVPVAGDAGHFPIGESLGPHARPWNLGAKFKESEVREQMGGPQDEDPGPPDPVEVYLRQAARLRETFGALWQQLLLAHEAIPEASRPDVNRPQMILEAAGFERARRWEPPKEEVKQ